MTAAIVKVAFEGDELDCVRDDRGVWVSVRRVCDALGLGYSSQLQKLKGKAWAGMTTIVTPSAGGPQQTSMLHLDALPMWLATIEPGRVSADSRPALERYQTRAAAVLRDHFFGSPKPPPVIEIGPADQLSEERARQAGRAVELALRAGQIDEAGAAVRHAAIIKAASGFDVLAVPEGAAWQRALPAIADLAPGESVTITKNVDTAGHYTANALGAPYGLSGRAVGDIARATGIFKVEGWGKPVAQTRADGKRLDDAWLYNEAAKAELAPNLAEEQARRLAAAEQKAARSADRAARASARGAAAAVAASVNGRPS